MTLPLGGRGKKAPYETILLRVPVPIVPQVKQQIEEYREVVIEGKRSPTVESESLPYMPVSKTYQEALEEARKIAKLKKSSSESLAKLLQVLYGFEVTKEDIKQ